LTNLDVRFIVNTSNNFDVRIMAMDYEEQAKIFKAFCDGKRLRILELLRGGEKCACALQENLDLGQSGLSYHMKILTESGIVSARQDGKWTHYRISEDGCAFAKTLLQELTTPGKVHMDLPTSGQVCDDRTSADVKCEDMTACRC